MGRKQTSDSQNGPTGGVNLDPSERTGLFGGRRIFDSLKPNTATGSGLLGNPIWQRKQSTDDADLERRWQPFRSVSSSTGLETSPMSDRPWVNQLSNEEVEEKREWKPVLRLGQTGNLRSARRFEMESRPSLFEKRPQVFYDPELDQQSSDRDGVMDRMTQRSQQAWSNTTSWFSERNQNWRQKANQTWQNLGWSQNESDVAPQSGGRALFPRPLTDRQQNRSDRLPTDRF